MDGGKPALRVNTGMNKVFVRAIFPFMTSLVEAGLSHTQASFSPRTLVQSLLTVVPVTCPQI
ncbi:hypothetical protein L573_3107 [Bordetella holmesii H620]|nr:hypothetical protein L573_3107 [Bordetella holmesii H620]KCV01356.1 hypothetical protein L501_0443 [Bordetella holmesii CDC-H719-BH]